MNDRPDQWERDEMQDIDPTRDNPEDDYDAEDALRWARAIMLAMTIGAVGVIVWRLIS